MARRTKEDALVTRHQILDAAERVFHERGVSRTSLQEIAQAAGVTRGAIYWHFQDKSDLFNAMLERVTLPLEDSVKRSDDPDLADPLAFIRSTVMDALHKTVHNPQVRRVFEIATHKVEYGDETKAVRERRLAARNDVMSHVERGLNLAMQRGLLWKGIPARSAAIGMHALIDGLIQNWILDPDGFDLMEVGMQVFDAYMAGVARPGEPWPGA